MNNSAGAVIAAIIGIIVLALGLSLLLAFPVMWLWNFAIAGETGGVLAAAAPLTFWKSWCLMVLCHFLFKANVTVNKDK